MGPSSDHNSRRFADRVEAGNALADRVADAELPKPIVVLALPRGGVPLAACIARRLDAPIDLVFVGKIGLPWQRELAVAAVAAGEPPDVVYEAGVLASSSLEAGFVADQIETTLIKLARQRREFLSDRPPLDLAGSTAVVVDDGIATGTTMRAALRQVWRRHPTLMILAVPVAPADTLASMHGEADDVICLQQPDPFRAVGEHYVDFHQVEDSRGEGCARRPARRAVMERRSTPGRAGCH